MKSSTSISYYNDIDQNDQQSNFNIFKTNKKVYKQHNKNTEKYNDYFSTSSSIKNIGQHNKITHRENIIVQAFSPYHFSSSQIKQSLFQQQQVPTSDRFIPTRKYINKQSNLLSQKLQKHDENYIPPAVDPHHFTASQIYKRFILSQNNHHNNSLIEMYKNQNYLKFGENKKTCILNENVQLSKKKNEFQFAQRLLSSTVAKRKIHKLPYKVLDAPALQDDFYLNLIDWSTQNFLAVGLSSNVYLWNGNNSKVTKLCDLGLSDTVTSVGWSVKGPLFSLGTNNGELHLWDLNKMKRVRNMNGHTDRIASISWNNDTISTGSRDKNILQRDPRAKGSFFTKLTHHKQQVCGLKWSPDGQQLCSGGNDNKLYIWNLKSSQPVAKYSDHIAAVKAVAWSPHQHGLLLSGGGTADKTIKFRNTLQGTTIKSIDTGSQVCNLIFSKTLNEFVSTHGFSLNQINVWKYPKMQKISTLTGHTFRVLYLAMSPDGSTIVTGAGDQTLRFWRVFPGRNQLNKPQKSLLQVDNMNIR